MGSNGEFIELNTRPEFEETTLDLAISKAQAKSSIPTIALLSAAVSSCVVGFGLTLLLYLWVFHTTSAEGSTLVTTAPIQFITAITQALSTCVARSIPIVVSVYAYSLAAEWLTTSQLPNNPERPSALHLGLLMTVVQGASLFSWITTAAQVSRLKRSSKQAVQSIPGILQRSIWVIGSLLLLSYLTSAFDTWLHVSSTAKFIQYEQPYRSEEIFFGKEVNETRCAYYAAKNPNSFLGPVCGLFQPEIHGSDVSASATEAILTIGNASTSNFVQLTDDQHAILVPALIPPHIAYSASTIGVKSQCRSLTRECLDASAMTGSFPSFHCHGTQPILVNNTIFAAFPDVNGAIFGVRNSTGGIAYTSADQYSFQAASTNPFQFVTVQLSQMLAVANPSQSQFIGDSGFFYTSAYAGTAYNLITCDVSVRNVAYKYRDMSQGEGSTPIPRFTTQSYWMSDIRTTKLLATLLDTGWVAAAVSARSLGAATEPGSGFEEAFARALSISMVAFSASIFTEAPALSAVSLKPVLVSKIPFPPLIGFGITISAFFFWVIGLSMKAVQCARSTSMTHLGQMNLTSPQCILHHFLPNVQAQATWSSDSAKLFDEEAEEGLMIGHYPSPNGGSHFGIGHATDTQLLMNNRLCAEPDLVSRHPLKKFASASALTTFQTGIFGNQSPQPTLGLVFVTLVLLAILLSLVTFLLIYVLSNDHSFRSGGVLRTTADLSYVLAVSQSISTLMSLAVAPIMGLHAFYLASVWATSTQAFEVPVPSELCRLFYMIQGASLWSFVLQHNLKLKKRLTRGDRGPRTFYMVSEAVYVLGCLLLVSNLAVVVDNWFHISSSSFSTSSYSQQQPSNRNLFGRQVDVSRCSQYSASAPGTNVTAVRQLCGLLTDEGDVGPNVIAQAQQTWSNTRSAINRITMTQDRHAILVPANLPATIGYQAMTIGVQATCESITRRCVDNASPQNQEQWAIWGVPWFNCSGSPPINVNNSLLQTSPWISLFGILNPETGDIVDGSTNRAYEVAESSPLQMVMIAANVAGQEPGHSTSYFTDNGFTFSPEAFAGWQLLHCTVAINEVKYQYDGNGSTFTTLWTNNASTQTTKMVMASTDHYQMANVVALMADVLYNADEYSANYARQHSSVLLADVSLVFSAIGAEKVWNIEAKLGSQLQILPFVIFLLLTGIFCALAILILIRTASHWNASPIARMAHDRFMSPLPIVMQLFGPMDAMKLAEGSEARRRLEDHDDNRLNIGPLETRDGCLFTIYKACSHEGRYSEGEANPTFTCSPSGFGDVSSRSWAST